MPRYAAVLVAVALAWEAVSAHHAIERLYDLGRTVRLEGELAQVTFRNPHSIVQLIVRDKAGREVRYAVEWAAAGLLEDQGVTSRTLHVGDHLIITGSPGRNPGDHRVRMATLHRPKDNFTYQGSMEPSKVP